MSPRPYRPYNPVRMHCLGILKARSIEIVDVTVRDGSLIPLHCPGELSSPCDRCSYARMMGSGPAVPNALPGNRTRRRNVSLIICHWFEQQAPG